MTGIEDDSPEAFEYRVDPVRRLRLARRVAKQLNDLGEDVLVEIVGEPARQLAGGLSSDFVVTSYDLIVRVALLVENELEDPTKLHRHVASAQELLDVYPDTDAVVIVIDDPDLTSQLVEPFDRELALRLPVGVTPRTVNHPRRTAPIRALLQDYLRDLSPVWDQFADLRFLNTTDLDQVASARALQALAEYQAEYFRIPEKREAQMRASEVDAQFAARLCMNVMRDDADVIKQIVDWTEVG